MLEINKHILTFIYTFDINTHILKKIYMSYNINIISVSCFTVKFSKYRIIVYIMRNGRFAIIYHLQCFTFLTSLEKHCEWTDIPHFQYIIVR